MINSESFNEYLAVTPFFDYDHPEVQTFADKVTEGITNPKEIAVRLYYAVRDQVKYNPYVFSEKAETFKASYALITGKSYCIPKAILLGAAARYKGIPTRLGLADVKNHIASPQFLEFLQSNIFVMHGFTDFYLDGRWVTATPAFNASLCEHMKVAPLDFDGVHDSLFHEYTEDGSLHMEYVKKHGEFAEVPLELIIKTLKEAYPHLFKEIAKIEDSRSFEKDLQHEKN